MALLFDGFDRLDDGVEIRPVAGIEFGVDEFSMGANFEGTTARRNKSERFDALAEFENLGRQTDGLGRVVSNHTIFDRNFGLHSRPPLQERRVRKRWEGVKVCGENIPAACAAIRDAFSQQLSS